MSDKFLTVSAEDFRNDYDNMIVDICKALFAQVLESAGQIVNDKGESLKLNVADLCNTLTNVAQRYRAENQ